MSVARRRDRSDLDVASPRLLAQPAGISAATAEEYVRALFQHVLERASTTEEEISYWTSEIVGGRSIADVLARFVDSDENQSRMRTLRANSTRFPHGHFYSPVVDVDEARAQSDRIFQRRTLPAIDLNDGVQAERLRDIARFAEQAPFQDESDGVHRYHYGNSSYGYGDAVVYWGFVGLLRPRRVIEIGCGYTSALILDAIDALDLKTRCTFIDPFPGLLRDVAKPIDARHEVIEGIVQNVDPAIVEQLSAGDILFIDSSHVVKTGSDVHFAITELLPRLTPGVAVHFHDVFHPFEYPASWVLDERYSWNELYFVHSFLMFNSAFRIEYFNHFMAREHAAKIRAALPQPMATRILRNPGGGLWLRRT